MTYWVEFEDTSGWNAGISVKAETWQEAVTRATAEIGKDERGAKLSEVRSIEIDIEDE